MAETASIVLDIAGPRGGLTKETAVELAAPVLVDNKQDFTGLRLSTWAFCEESAEVFASVIDKLPELKAAHLADIIAGRPMAEGVRVYEVLSAALAKKQLHLIDLSDNAVGPSGIAALRPMLAAQEELKELFLSNVGLSAECCRDVADMMTFRTPTKLTRLILHNNMSGSDGAIAIADIVKASPVLEDFQFSASRGGAEGGEALASALAATSSLKRLDLHDNTFGAETGRLLGITLAKQSSLSHLNIADIGLEDEGLEAVMPGLLKARAITHLDIQANDFTVDAAQHIAKLIKRLPNLREINLRDNIISNVGARLIAKALLARKHATIQSINVAFCEISDPGALALANAVANAPSCVGATSLNLNGNMISATALDTIRELFAAKEAESFLGTLSDNDEEADPEDAEDDPDVELEDDDDDEEEDAAAEEEEDAEVDALATALGSL